MFNQAQAITKSEKKVNEDYYRLSKNYAWLLDGASGLTENKLTLAPTDAKWLVEAIDNTLQEKIAQTDQTLVKIVQETMDCVSHEFLSSIEGKKYEKYELPSSTLCLVRENANKLEYYSIGDSFILIKMKTGEVIQIYDTPLTQMEETALRKLQELSKEKKLPLVKCRPFVQEMLIGYRKLKNTQEGYWVFSIEDNDASKGIYGELPLEAVESICLLSDGFAQYFEVLQLAEDAGEFISKLEECSVEELFKTLKKAQDEDADCTLYPRLKKSDDTTAVYIKL
ncbi:MAG: protein phosphatase 2C domain-containing protein [Cellulosilyticaceae bacterium]